MSLQQTSVQGRNDGRQDAEDKHAEAERLTSLSNGAVPVVFDPALQQIDELGLPDPSSRGHLYTGELDPEIADSVRHCWLDDRRDEVLEVQLAAELRRIAALYESLAERVELAVEKTTAV